MVKYDVIKEYAEKHPSKAALIYEDEVISWRDFMLYTNLLIKDFVLFAGNI